MATKVYFRTFPGGLDVSSWAEALPLPRPARNTSGTGDAANGLTTAVPTQATPGSALQIDTTAGGTDILVHEFISQPLTADVTIAGTVTFNIWGIESNMNNNAGCRVKVFKVAATTGTTTAIVDSSRGVELGTTVAVQNWTATPTSTVCAKGDYLLIQIAVTNVGTMAAAASGVTIDVDGSTAAADGDSWVQFTEAVAFTTSAPAGTTLYLTDTASDVSTADDDRALDFSRGGGSVTGSVALVTGGISPTQLQRSGTNMRWYSPQLQAVTLTGPVRANLRCYSNVASQQDGVVVELLKRTAAGVETTIGKVAWNWGGNLPNTDGGTGSPEIVTFGIPDTTLANGDRIGFIVYGDDACIANINSNNTMSMSYNGTSAAAAGDSYITLAQSVLQFSSTLPFNTSEGEAHSDPRSLQLLTRASVRRASTFCLGDKWARHKGKLWLPKREIVLPV